MSSRRSRAGVAVLLIALFAVLVPLRPAAAADDAASFASSGHGDTDVRGTFGAANFFFPLPPGQQVSGPVSLDLDISHSPLLVPELSTVSVRVNDVSLASAFLDRSNLNHGHLAVAVPPELIDRGVFVEARFYMRLTRDDCEEPNNPGLWATVHRSSTITLPTADAGPRDLADAPELVIPATKDAAPLTIVVPPRPSATMLRAIGVVAATAGRWLGLAGRDGLVTTAIVAPDDGPSIVVGNGGASLQAPHGMLALDQEGGVSLHVTGSNDAAVLEAARALRFVDTLHGGEIRLSGARPPSSPRRSAPWTASAASFAQLGLDRIDVAGPGTHVTDLVVERPSGWRVHKSATIALDLDTAPGVRRGPSYVQVTANGIDIGTRRLQPGDGAQRYRFTMSGSLLDRDLRGRPTRALRLRIRTHLQPEQQRCTPLDADATKASINRTSSITLPHETAGSHELGRFPASLLPGGPLVVVADNNANSVDEGVRMAAAIGRWSAARDAAPELVTAASAPKNGRAVRNVVLLGGADRALVGHRVGIEREPVGVAADRVVAYAGLVDSPLGGERTALVVHGDHDGIIAATRALASLDAVESVAGDVVAVSDDHAQTVRGDNAASPPPPLAPTLERTGIRNEAVVAAIVLAAFVIALVLVVRFRWWPARRP